jgi:uncharacterized protein (TIGR03435 family)
MIKWSSRNCKKLVLIAAGAIAACVPVFGQAMSSDAKAPAFDVISIRPHNPENQRMWIMFKPDGYSAGGASVRSLIESAYTVKADDLVSGISGSVAGAQFDVEAKLDPDTVQAFKKLTEEEKWAQRHLMMQAMLAERFKLKIHHETKEVPIYKLVIAKGGFKLKAADPSNTYPNGMKGPDGISHAGMMMVGNGMLTGQGIPMLSLAANLGGQVHRIVEDKTGLTGKYDLTLHWSKDDLGGPQDTTATTPDSAPSIFTALQEQLGLKLEPTKESVETIVVDHVEMPSEN